MPRAPARKKKNDKAGGNAARGAAVASSKVMGSWLSRSSDSSLPDSYVSSAQSTERAGNTSRPGGRIPSAAGRETARRVGEGATPLDALQGSSRSVPALFHSRVARSRGPAGNARDGPHLADVDALAESSSREDDTRALLTPSPTWNPTQVDVGDDDEEPPSDQQGGAAAPRTPVALPPIADDNNIDPMDIDSASTPPNGPVVVEVPANNVDEDLSEVETVAKMLCRELGIDGIGCAVGEHEKAHLRHLVASPDNHHDLSVTYEGFEVDVDATRRHEVGIQSPRVPPPAGVDRMAYVPPSTLHSCFHGCESSATDNVRNVCLHKEEEDGAVDAFQHIAYDVDSIMVFIPTLGAIRQHFYWNLDPLTSVNLKSSVHYKKWIVSSEGAHVEVPLEDIPHLPLGKVEGMHRNNVILFCPKMWSKGRQSNFLKSADKARFNNLMLRAVGAWAEPTNVQYYPPSQRTAVNEAGAKKERRARQGASTHKRSPEWFVAAETLEDVWKRVLEGIRGYPEFADFQDAFLMVNAIGIKMRQKQSRLLSALDSFHNEYLEIFDDTRVSELLVDIGREIAPQPTRSVVGGRAPDAQTLLWKRCCLDATLLRFQQELFGGRKGQSTVFNVGFLRDAACMTLTPPQTSVATYGGLLYAQWYNSVKRVGDAEAIYLFDWPPLLELAIDEGVWTASASIKGALGSKSYPELLSDFQEAKKRALDAYTDSMTKAYGIRVEFRVNRELFRALRERARRDRIPHPPSPAPARSDVVPSSSPAPTSEGSSPPAPYLAAHQTLPRQVPRSARSAETPGSSGVRYSPSPSTRSDWSDEPLQLDACWSVSSERFLAFVLGNYNKFLTAFEVSSVTSPETGITAERSRLRAVLIACMMRFINAHLPRETYLWIDGQREQHTDRWGLGMKRTMVENGFGWFLPIINWETFLFSGQPSGKLAGMDRATLRWFPEGSRLLQDEDALLQVAFDRLPKCVPGSRLCLAVCDYMIQILTRKWRRDVLDTLNRMGDLRPEYNDDKKREGIRFSQQGIFDAAHKPINIVGGRAKATTAARLFEWIWGTTEDPELKRTFFDKKPFRIALRKVLVAIKIGAPHGFREFWDERFLLEFFRFHWLVAYPDGSGTLIATSKVSSKKVGKEQPRRQWWASRVVGGRVEWLKEKADGGYPDAYPITLGFGVDELRQHFDVCGVPRHWPK